MKLSTARQFLITGAALALSRAAAAQPATARKIDGTSPVMGGTQTVQQAVRQRGAWMQDAQFAMFIHWGLYSELGGCWHGKTYYGVAEWIMNRAQIPAAEYAQLASKFNPTAFNAREWVQLAKAAGMRYIIITAKHHEGFAMFHSKASAFNIVDATPFKRDPLKELADACAAAGVKLGFYYSQTQDWHEPDAVGNTWDKRSQPPDFERYLHHKVIPQLKELLTNYGPVAAIWFDTPGPITPAESKMLVDLVHRLQPECLVNSRIGNGLGDFDTLGDQEIPPLPRPGLWQSIDTTNDSWAYAKADQNWKSPREIAERLVRVVSRGGTYLLNVGPDGTGRIPQPAQDALCAVGAWTAAHRDAIYGAGPSPLGPLPWGECTARPGLLFLHVFHWPLDGRLIVPGVKLEVNRARLMDGTGRVVIEPAADGIILRVPRLRPDSLIPVIELQANGPVRASHEQYILNATENRLDASTARCVGCTEKKVHWMEKFGDWKHADVLGAWVPAGARASWSFRTVEPGRFYVDVDYTTGKKGDYSEWKLTIDGQSRTFPLIDTGERASRAVWAGEFPRFRYYHAGLVELTTPGPHELSLRPLDRAGASVRIAGLVLTPVDQHPPGW